MSGLKQGRWVTWPLVSTLRGGHWVQAVLEKGVERLSGLLVFFVWVFLVFFFL